MPRLLERYRETIVPSLQEKLGRRNVLSLPRLEKIVVSMGLGKSRDEPKRIEAAVKDLATLTGQRPVLTKAKKSVAAFHVRQGVMVGAMVTLRGRRMYEFLDRLINVAIPRIRDFRGLTRKFDGHGNYTLGLDEQIVFPEVSIDKVQNIQGMHITLVLRNATDGTSYELLRMLGMPFRRDDQQF